MGSMPVMGLEQCQDIHGIVLLFKERTTHPFPPSPVSAYPPCAGISEGAEVQTLLPPGHGTKAEGRDRGCRM